MCSSSTSAMACCSEISPDSSLDSRHSLWIIFIRRRDLATGLIGSITQIVFCSSLTFSLKQAWLLFCLEVMAGLDMLMSRNSNPH